MTLQKIVVNMGVGRAKENKEFLESARQDLALITGQRPAARASKKDISGFKIRTGDLVGLMVTLRGKRMWAFFKKLIDVVLPRIGGFRGVSRSSFDGQGNYNLGMAEHTVFPEIDPNKVVEIKSLGITIVTDAKNDQEGVKLLEELGMPFEHG